MNFAIIVKQSGSNSNGTLMSASYGNRSMHWNHDAKLSWDENALRAARALCDKLKLNASMLVGGELPNGDRVFVFAVR